MLKPEEEGQTNQPEAPMIENETNTGAEQTKQGFNQIKGAWNSSLIMKIIFIGVAALFVLFFILMIVFAAQSSCTSYKDDIDTKSSQIDALKKNNTDLQTKLTKANSDLDTCNKNNNECQSSYSKCKTDYSTCSSSLEDANKQLKQAKSDLETCNQAKSDLEYQNQQLKNQIASLQSQLTTCKSTVEEQKKTIDKQKQTSTYQWYGIGGEAIAILGETIGLIASGVSNGNLKSEITSLNSQVDSLKGEVVNLQKEIKVKDAEIQKAKEALDDCNTLRQTCSKQLATCNVEKDTLQKEVENLHWQVDIIPKLAVDQAKLQLLAEDTGYTVSHTLLFNGTRDGYTKDALYSRLGDKSPLIIVVRSQAGFVFGAALNVSWPQATGYKKDQNAYTFSTTRDQICLVKDLGENAIYNSADSFLQIGDNEFVFGLSSTKHTSGEAESDKTFACGSSSHESFYNSKKHVDVKDFYIYQVHLHPYNP